MDITQPLLAFQTIGLLYHPKLAESRVMVAEILEFLEGVGASAWVSSSWDEDTIKERLEHVDLLITLGGDGSMLRAARMVAKNPVAILGINMGRLGFLVEVQPAEWRQRLQQAMRGDYWIETRMMIRAKLYRRGQLVNVFEGMNEIVIGRGQMARVVRLHTYIDGGYLTTYTADGLIVSTATGSTAYALAAGGPILPPELENFLLIPLAPHLTLDRAIVLSKGVTVRLQVSTDHSTVLTVDGQLALELNHDDEVVISGSPSVGKFVRLQEKNYFYKSLMESLGITQSNNKRKG